MNSLLDLNGDIVIEMYLILNANEWSSYYTFGTIIVLS